jgi:hypothetical protein
MAFEPLLIQKWIYDTLSSDSTLASLLAGGKAAFYQQGISSVVAPEKDSVSQKMPQLPYVVFSRAGSDINDEAAICGTRFFTIPVYRVTVWNNSNGSLSYKGMKDIIDRIDTLLGEEKVTDSGVTWYCQRFDTDQPIQVQSDGRVDFGLTILYRFTTII